MFGFGARDTSRVLREQVFLLPSGGLGGERNYGREALGVAGPPVLIGCEKGASVLTAKSPALCVLQSTKAGWGRVLLS